MNEVSPIRLTFSSVILKISAAGLFISNFYFFFKEETKFFTKVTNGDTSWISTFVQCTVIHLLIFLLFVALLNRNKKMNLADSDLLSVSQVNREQIRKKNSGSLYVRPRFYFLMPQFIKRFFSYYNKESAIRLSRNIKVSEKKMNESVVVFGPTGSGKTVSTYLPILLETNGTHSFLVSDPKGELHHKTRKSLEKKGYQVFHINFTEPRNGEQIKTDNYSLLQNCKSFDDIRSLSSSIVESGGEKDIWTEMAKYVLNCFLFHTYSKKGTMKDFVKLFKETQPDDYEKFFLTASTPEAKSEFQLLQKMMTADTMMGSIQGTVNGKITVFLYDSVQKIEASSDFTIDDIRNKKTAVFFTFPTGKKETYAAFQAPFLSRILSDLQEHESVRNEENQPGRPVLCLFDEFGTSITKIPNFSDRLATTRSRKISFVLGIQSIEQLKKVYGDEAKIIVENAKTKLALRGLTDTAEVFSKLLGEKEFKQISYSNSSGAKGYTTSESVTKKPVMTADEIRQLKTHETIIVFDNLRGIKDDTNLYYFDDFELFLYKNLNINDEYSSKVIKFLTSFYKNEKNKKIIKNIKHFIRTKILKEKELTEEEKEDRKIKQKSAFSRLSFTKEKEKNKQERKEMKEQNKQTSYVEEDLDEETVNLLSDVLNTTKSTKKKNETQDSSTTSTAREVHNESKNEQKQEENEYEYEFYSGTRENRRENKYKKDRELF